MTESFLNSTFGVMNRLLSFDVFQRQRVEKRNEVRRTSKTHGILTCVDSDSGQEFFQDVKVVNWSDGGVCAAFRDCPHMDLLYSIRFCLLETREPHLVEVRWIRRIRRVFLVGLKLIE
ncbi:MAG: hypothetical protein GF384_00255 [Elusimicrobia bacterium]|nr:hypothetical protein [Elusimicrobiota bacterium]MBD3411528.1 hypothetical protein [Elusimicrobiota bacterium]